MNYHRWTTFILLLLPLLVGAQSSEKRLSVVVYNLEAQGIGASITDILTSAVVSELSNSEKLFVRDEKTTIAVLKEKGMAQTDYCSAEVCRIDNAKLIKADRIIIGNIGKLEEKLFLVNIRVADVNGTTMYNQKERCRDCSTDKLLGMVEVMAKNIRVYLETGKKPKKEEPIQVGDQGTTTSPTTGTATTHGQTPATATGTLEVRTNPPGARIFIDSEEVGVSNKTIQVSAGEHEVVLVKDGHADVSQKLTVPAGRTVIFTKNLPAQVGEIEVTVNVAGATIYLDGKQMGTSAGGRGFKIPGVGVGNHKIRVVHTSYEASEQAVSVAPNQVNPVMINLAGKPGKILITSSPSGAVVSIGGSSKGKTPLSLSLAPGSHTAEVSLDGYETAQQNFQVEAGKSGTIKVILKKIQRAITQPSAPTYSPPPTTPARGDMVQVPAGEFTMGSNSGSDNEKPEHRVYLDAFYIDKYEVTNDQYAACVRSGKCEAAHFDDGSCYVNSGGSWNKGTLPQSFRGGNQPVVCIDWNQAKDYCEFSGKRLPTEAEWEKAARGTDGRKFPWGNQDASCNFAIMNDSGLGCGKQTTWPVGSKPNGASPYGAMDMAGNVWEWVADWYGGDYYKNSPNRNPAGPSSGSSRVLRGGSWDYYQSYLRASLRNFNTPDYGYYFHFGSRCASG